MGELDSEPSDLNCLFVKPRPRTDRECDFCVEVAASMRSTRLSVKTPEYFPEENNFQKIGRAKD